MSKAQATIDQANAEFWNELCGSNLATELGITDSSPASLAKFDNWYFNNMYPYLMPIVNPERMRGRRVLEIGLGYGSLGQRLALDGATYTGMDIASKPVAHMNWRLQLENLPGRAVQGSALEMPFPDESFDFLISIGCFHHTGNVQRCFDETHRVLAPGGCAIAMVYNKYSLREWLNRPLGTLRSLLPRSIQRLDDAARREYDAKLDGTAAPETVLLSSRQVRKILTQFHSVRCRKRNSDHVYYKGDILLDREKLLGIVGPLAGLDIYIEAHKPRAAPRRQAA